MPSQVHDAPGAVQDVLHIYTDGSCRGNGTPTALSGCGVWFGDGDARNVSAALPWPPHTNQRAELGAVLLALHAVLASPLRGAGVSLTSDSKYCVEGITSWVAKWEAKDWRRYDGGPVANLDLWQAVRAAMLALDKRGTALRLTWTKGHASDAGNEAADKLASAAVRRVAADMLAYDPRTAADPYLAAHAQQATNNNCPESS